MNAYLLLLACPLICFALHMLAGLVLGPLGQKGVALCGLAAVAGYGLLGFTDGLWAGIYFFLIALCFGYSYFHLFNMALTARRIELLIRKLEGREAGYEPRQIVQQRIARLRQLGTLEEANGRLKLKNGPLWLAAWGIGQLRRLFYPSAQAQ